MTALCICLFTSFAAVTLSAPTGEASRQQVPVVWNTPAGIFRYLLQGVLFDGYKSQGDIRAPLPSDSFIYVSGDITLKNTVINFGRLTITHENGTGSEGNHSLNVVATLTASFDYPWRAVGDEECHRTGELRSVGELELEAIDFELSFEQPTGGNVPAQPRLRVSGFKTVEAANRKLRISGFRTDAPNSINNLATELLRGVLAEALEAKVADAVTLFNWSA